MPRSLTHLVLVLALAVAHCAVPTQADGAPIPADGKVRTHGTGRQPGLSVVAAGRLKDDASSAWFWAELVHPASGPVPGVTRVAMTSLAPPRFACAGQHTLAARAPPLA